MTYILLNNIYLKTCTANFSVLNAALVLASIVLQVLPPDDPIRVIWGLVLAVVVVEFARVLRWCSLVGWGCWLH